MSNFDWPAATNEARERLGDRFDKLNLETRISTTKNRVLPSADPVVTPIYHSSTYRFNTVKQFNDDSHGQNYVYQRCGNPTVENVEVLIRELEGGAGTTVYSSGLQAVSAILLEFLSAGDHLIAMKPMYSGTYSFITETLVRFGVEVTWVDVEKESDFGAACAKVAKDNTKMVLVEVMANPTMAMPDLLSVFAFAKEKKVLSVVDATFASPYNIQPIKLGADFSFHSCSKYIGGHTDVIAGCVTTATEENWQRLKLQQLTTGSTLPPFEAALITRGLKTLALRVDRISDNAQKVSEWLQTHPKVKHVYYGGLPSHPTHKAASKYMTKFAGMVAFDVGTAEAAVHLVESVKLIIHAVSLGGTESLIEHPLSMSHGAQLLRSEDAPKVAHGLLRFSIGIEHPDDIIEDLRQALDSFSG